MGRNRQKQLKEQKRRRKQREKARKQQENSASHNFDISLDVQGSEFAHEPRFMSDSATRVSDPRTTLGLDSTCEHSSETVLAAFNAALAHTSPEAAPERARELLEARKRLLDPSEIMTRTLGDLRVPNPASFIPGFVPRPKLSSPKKATKHSDWNSRARMITLVTLFALLEDEIDGGNDNSKNGKLPF